jgi:pimeloyl-ACP methyl ester carboxylesterase
MKAQIRGITLGYSDQGTGNPIVFLHAFPLNRSMWAEQEAALSQWFRIITVDLRGHGESDAPLWHSSLDEYADDIAALLDHLSIPQAILIGLSMGGYVSFSFYRKHSRRVRGLILADTRAPADSDEARAGRFQLAQTAYREGAAAVADLMLPKLLGPTALRTRADLVDQVRRMIKANEISGIVVDAMAMAERPDSLALLPTIACPTLVIVGDEDQATPPAEAELMARSIPQARLAVIPGAGHLSNLEQPEQFNMLVKDFVEGVNGT